MNPFYYRLIVVSLVLTSLSLASCVKPCDPALNAEVGQEFFTVTYTNNDGTINYLNDVYNPAGVVVFLDTAGGANPNPKYELISPGFADGKFGPFYFTEKFLDLASNEINLPLLFERPMKFDYYFKKDTYGQDTLSVSFLLEVDECNHKWRYITYSLNGDPLPYDGQRQAEILIRE